MPPQLLPDDTDLDAIAAQVRSHPPLSSVEVARLLRDARDAGATDQQDRLVEHHLAVALGAALERRDRGTDVVDLYGEATVALVQAVKDFVASTGAAEDLGVEMLAAVDQHLESFLAHEEEERKIQAALLADTSLLSAVQIRLRAELDHEPTVLELAAVLTWAPEKVERLVEMLVRARKLYDSEIIPYLDDADEMDGEEE